MWNWRPNSLKNEENSTLEPLPVFILYLNYFLQKKWRKILKTLVISNEIFKDSSGFDMFMEQILGHEHNYSFGLVMFITQNVFQKQVKTWGTF